MFQSLRSKPEMFLESAQEYFENFFRIFLRWLPCFRLLRAGFPLIDPKGTLPLAFSVL